MICNHLKVKDIFIIALQDYSTAIELDPKSKYYSQRGNFFSDLKLNDEAIQDYNLAIELDKNNPEPHYYKTNLFTSLIKFEEALESINKAIDLSSKSIFYSTRASIFSYLSNFEMSFKDIVKSLEINCNNPYSYTFLRLIFKNLSISDQRFRNIFEMLEKCITQESLILSETLNSILNFDENNNNNNIFTELINLKKLVNNNLTCSTLISKLFSTFNLDRNLFNSIESLCKYSPPLTKDEWIEVESNKNILLNKKFISKVNGKKIFGKEINKNELQEIYILKKFSFHPNIFNSYFSWYLNEEGNVFIVLEYLNTFGNLLSFVDKYKEDITIKIKIEIAKQVCSAIACLHIHGIAWKDLKPENIIVNEFSKEEEKISIRIIDFDISSNLKNNIFTEFEKENLNLKKF